MAKQEISGAREEPRKSRFFTELYEWVESAIFAVVFVILLFTFVARTSQVSGPSMFPTLHDRDMLVISRAFYKPKQGDIVVLTKPFSQNEPFVKRIIAMEGQEVNIDFRSGVVYVDGAPLDEPYVNEQTNTEMDVQFPVTVPKGMLFVMGDNRNHSLDSRSTDIGMVDERYVLGKAIYRLYPFDKAGAL